MMKDNYFSRDMGFPKDKRQEIFFLPSALFSPKSKCNGELFVVGINNVIIDVVLGSSPGYRFRNKDFKFEDEVTTALIDAQKVALHSNKTLCKREKQFINFLRSTKSIRPLCL